MADFETSMTTGVKPGVPRAVPHHCCRIVYRSVIAVVVEHLTHLCCSGFLHSRFIV